jgi:hypothetical protein
MAVQRVYLGALRAMGFGPRPYPGRTATVETVVSLDCREQPIIGRRT